MESSDIDQVKKKVTELKTFPVPFSLIETKGNLTVNTDTPSKPSKEQIFNKAIRFHSQGNISEAVKYYQYFINQGFNDFRVFLNYGKILIDLGKLKEAEINIRKSIKIKPDHADSFYNLGNLLKRLGKLQQAEISFRKAIELNPTFAEAFLNLGNILKDLEKLKEAETCYLKAIKIKPNFALAHSNLGSLLMDLGKSKEAEKSIRKAININPNIALAHSNLGSILMDLGKLQEAEISFRKAIDLKLDLSKAYFALSILNPLCDNKSWHDRLFSENIIKNQRRKDLVDIYFARANISEEKHNFSEASNFLKKANNLNREIYGSDYSKISHKIESCYQVWEENKFDLNQKKNFPIPIFIVGLPRSGKTMTESILACNDNLIKCGEDSALEKAIKIYLEEKENSLDPSLLKLYFDNIEEDIFGKSFTCTTKPMNLTYISLITSQISTAKVIYCYRNPLDNILEIYKKNMFNRHTYSCSISESANLYLEAYSLMKEYQKRFNSKIYFLNYDELVTNTGEEIKYLLNWLGWRNKKKYIEPSLDVTTRKITKKFDSKIINKCEISSWKNYRDLLKPAIQLFSSSKKFKILFKQYLEEMDQF